MLLESDKEKIRKEAREVLEKFGKALDKIDVQNLKKEERIGGYRIEKEAGECSDDFRRRFFNNAPNKNEDSILAEKGNWS